MMMMFIIVMISRKWSVHSCNIISFSQINREAEDDWGELLLENRIYHVGILRSLRPENFSIHGFVCLLCGHHGKETLSAGLDLHESLSSHTHVHLSGQLDTHGCLLLLCHCSQDAIELLFYRQNDFSLWSEDTVLVSLSCWNYRLLPHGSNGLWLLCGLKQPIEVSQLDVQEALPSDTT